MNCAVCLYIKAKNPGALPPIEVFGAVTQVDGNLVCADHVRPMTQGWDGVRESIAKAQRRATTLIKVGDRVVDWEGTEAVVRALRCSQCQLRIPHDECGVFAQVADDRWVNVDFLTSGPPTSDDTCNP